MTYQNNHAVFPQARTKLIMKLLSCLVFLVMASVTSPVSAEKQGTYKIEMISPQGNRAIFQAELAHTPKTRRIGLMRRSSLARDKGMLFVWPQIAQRQFWMKNTLIPLDILFFSEDMVLVHIVRSAQPLSEELLSSQFPVRYVFEIQGGLAQHLGLNLGTRMVLHSALPPAQ